MKTIPYARQQLDSGDIKAVAWTLESDFITQGPKIKQFEDALCRYAGCKYAVVVSSGTAALHIAALAAGIKKYNEVITSPITFIASANCILYCGGRPVFADVQEDTVNIDPVEIKKRITKRTKALIPVHFSGHPCDLEEIALLAKKYNLIVIEDAAHALGAVYKNSKIGACKYSDMTVFSFHPVKTITTGEGGAVLTNKRELYERLLLFRNHGITRNPQKFTNPQYFFNNNLWYYEMQELGFNYRITDFQCALGISQLKKLNQFIMRRRKIVDSYNKRLSGVNDIILPLEKAYVKSSWHIYYIRLRDVLKRKNVFNQLRKSGITAQVHYIPVHLQPYYRNKFGYKLGDYPKAEDYYKRTITIPLYPKMESSQLDFIVKVLKRALR